MVCWRELLLSCLQWSSTTSGTLLQFSFSGLPRSSSFLPYLVPDLGLRIGIYRLGSAARLACRSLARSSLRVLSFCIVRCALMRFACVDAIGCGKNVTQKRPWGSKQRSVTGLKRANHMSVPIPFGYKKLRSDKAVKLLYLDSLG